MVSSVVILPVTTTITIYIGVFFIHELKRKPPKRAAYLKVSEKRVLSNNAENVFFAHKVHSFTVMLYFNCHLLVEQNDIAFLDL